MAPVLTAASGLAGGQLALVGTLTAVSVFLLLLLVLMLCASCQGQKKPNGHTGDHENLMNGVTERETFSQSVDSPCTDPVASSSLNGPLTSGTVLTDDTIDTSPQPSEDMLSSQSELRSSKCPQDRQLPSIPPSGALQGAPADPPAAPGDGTYEVVKEGASRDVSVEDSLYETVKEPRGDHVVGEEQSAPVPNGALSPGTPDRAPLLAGAEYASVDLNKKSRYSADLEARRHAEPPGEEPEDEKPPPVPDKVLDENDNDTESHQDDGAGIRNCQIASPSLTTPPTESPPLSESKLSAVYSSVSKPCAEDAYSSIAEMNGSLSESLSGDLYATVKDRQPPPDPQQDGATPADPDYETIGILKHEDGAGDSGAQGPAQKESDYESVGDLGMNGECSRL